MQKFKFEKLIIWQKAMDFGETINEICRASDSIALNISEGSIGQSNPEQKSL